MTLLLALSVPSLAATITVDPSDALAYATIQDGINAATDGDTVEIAGGTYYECIDTDGKDLTITGSSATVDGAGSCTSTVEVQGGETVTFSGLTIRNTTYRGAHTDNSTVRAGSRRR